MASDFDEAMRGLAARAVEDAQRRFNLSLTYELASVRDLERILDALSRQHREAPLGDRLLAEEADRWGAYLGEVIRRLKPGKWVLGSKTAGASCSTLLFEGDQELYPPAWCHRRIQNDPDVAEDNVWAKLELLQQRGFFSAAGIRNVPDAPPLAESRFLPVAVLIAGLILGAIHLGPSGHLRPSGLLVLGIICTLMGLASLVHPPVLWAIGPRRSAVPPRTRVIGTVVFAVVLAIATLGPLLLR